MHTANTVYRVYFKGINFCGMTVRGFRGIAAFLQHACMHVILNSWVQMVDQQKPQTFIPSKYTRYTVSCMIMGGSVISK